MSAGASRHREEVAELRESLQKQRQQQAGTPMKGVGNPGGDTDPMSPIPLPGIAQAQTPLTAGPFEISGMGSKSRFKDATALLGGSSAQQREISRLHSEIDSERRKLQGLQDTHNDLLSLLAQEELELGVFREMLESVGGEEKVQHALQLAQRAAVDKYGSYVNLHDTSLLMGGDGPSLDFGDGDD